MTNRTKITSTKATIPKNNEFRIRELQLLRQLADEHIELLAKDRILGFEPGARFEPKARRLRQLSQLVNHGR